MIAQMVEGGQRASRRSQRHRMGDGRHGRRRRACLREMHEAGAYTAARDEASCVVFRMPREAIKLGAADDVVPLAGIARWIVQTAGKPLRRPA